jgi:hypothetical protein
MNELLEALVVEEGDRDLKTEDMLPPTEVIECCQSLVLYEESSGLVRFTHYTVQEFITCKLEQKLPPIIHLTKTCLTYLLFDAFDTLCLDLKSVEKRVEKYKFSRYAAQFWVLYTKGEAENELDIQRAVLSLLASENKRDSMLQLEKYANSSWGNISFTKGQTLLHVIAKNGLTTICELVLHARINGNDKYVLEVDI